MAAAAGVPLATPSLRAAVASAASPAAPAAGDGPAAISAVISPGPGEVAAPAAEGGGPREAGSVPGKAAEAFGGLSPAGAREPQVADREPVPLAAPGVAAARGIGVTDLESTAALSAAGREATSLGQCSDRGHKPWQSAAATAPATPTRPEPGVDVAEPQRVAPPAGASIAARAFGAARGAGEHVAAAQGTMLPGSRLGSQSGLAGTAGCAAGPDALDASASAAACTGASDCSPAGAAGPAAALHGGAPLQAQEGGRNPVDVPQGGQQAGADCGRSNAVPGAPSGTLSLSVSGIELGELPES